MKLIVLSMIINIQFISTFLEVLLPYFPIGDNAAVIRELYQILEDDNLFPPHLIKYKYLRHALSHGSGLETNTLNNIERNFGKDYFVFTNGRFDYTSHINIRNLRIQAFNFMIEMLKKYENMC